MVRNEILDFLSQREYIPELGAEAGRKKQMRGNETRARRVAPVAARAAPWTMALPSEPRAASWPVVGGYQGLSIRGRVRDAKLGKVATGERECVKGAMA